MLTNVDTIQYIVLLIVLMAFYCLDEVNNFNVIFIGLTIALLYHTLYEWFRLKKQQSHLFLLNPIFLASGVNMLLSFGGLSNFLMYEDGEFYRRLPYLINIESNWYYLKAMIIVCMSSICMWIGYKIPIGHLVNKFYLNGIKMKRLFNRKINIYTIITLFIIGIISKYILFKYGLYGAIIDDAKTTFNSTPSFIYSQTRFIRNISTLSLVLISILFFQSKRNSILLSLFSITVLSEIVFSIFSGMRSPIVYTMIIVFFSQYFAIKKIKKIWFILIPTALFLAFTIAMSFKSFIRHNKTSEFSIGTIYQGFVAHNSRIDNTYNTDRFFKNISVRTNQLNQAVAAIKYSDNNEFRSQDPQFIKELLLVPYNTIVPSFIRNKPNISWGNWFRTEILGYSKNVRSNMAFTPLGYLYFCGGVGAVLIGFFIYGITMRFTNGFLHQGPLAFVFYILLLGAIIIFRTNIPGMMINILRIIVFYPILILALSTRSNK